MFCCPSLPAPSLLPSLPSSFLSRFSPSPSLEQKVYMLVNTTILVDICRGPNYTETRGFIESERLTGNLVPIENCWDLIKEVEIAIMTLSVIYRASSYLF